MLSRFKSERTGATAALLIDGSIVDDNIDGTNKFNYQWCKSKNGLVVPISPLNRTFKLV